MSYQLRRILQSAAIPCLTIVGFISGFDDGPLMPSSQCVH